MKMLVMKNKISEILEKKKDSIGRLLREYYSGSGYRYFHNIYRIRDGERKCKASQEIKSNFIEELRTFPQFSNQIVYRFDRVNNKTDSHKWFLANKGKIIKFPSFLSCSKNQNGIPAHNLKFKILTSQESNCFDVTSISSSSEKEVIFTLGTNFKIKDVLKDEKWIELIETEEQEDYIIYENEYFYYDFKACKDVKLLSMK